MTDGRAHGRADGRTDRRTDGLTNGRTDMTDGRIDERTDGRTDMTDDGRTDERTDGYSILPSVIEPPIHSTDASLQSVNTSVGTIVGKELIDRSVPNCQ